MSRLPSSNNSFDPHVTALLARLPPANRSVLNLLPTPLRRVRHLMSTWETDWDPEALFLLHHLTPTTLIYRFHPLWSSQLPQGCPWPYCLIPLSLLSLKVSLMKS